MILLLVVLCVVFWVVIMVLWVCGVKCLKFWFEFSVVVLVWGMNCFCVVCLVMFMFLLILD